MPIFHTPSINLHDHLEPLWLNCFSKILTKTAKVPKLLDGAKSAENYNQLDRAQQGYRRQTDDGTDGRLMPYANVT